MPPTSELLKALKSLLRSAIAAEEEARGPGRHPVFMALNRAKKELQQAVLAEEDHLEALASTAPKIPATVPHTMNEP